MNGHGTASGAVESEAQAVLECVKRVDVAASVSSIRRGEHGLIVKIAPSIDSGTAIALAMITAVRMAFPYSTSALVEDAMTGATELQVVLHAAREEFQNALVEVESMRFARFLNASANTAAVVALSSFACLLYAATISTTPIPV